MPSEDPFTRQKATGTVQVWACGRDSFELKRWDTERQAAREARAKVRDRLNEQLNAVPPGISPGAFAMPAAAPRPLQASQDAWCEHLDPSLDAATTKAAVVGNALGILASVLLMAKGVAFASPETHSYYSRLS